MGKGTIVSGGEDGLYSIQISYNRDRYTATIAVLNKNLEKLESEKHGLDDDYDDKESELIDAQRIAQVHADAYANWTALYQGYVKRRAEILDEIDKLEKELQELKDIGANQHSIEVKQDQISAAKEDLAANEALLVEARRESVNATNDFGEAYAKAQTISLELAGVQAKINEHDLQIAAITKRIETLENGMPADETVSAWCADLTEDLSGEVGTIEMPGERSLVQVWPGYFEEHPYDQTRDGQLFPTISMTAAQVFYNMSMFPGWQKWTPTFRHGTITAISGDYASVSLESATSSLLDMSINRVDSLSDVEIEYMYCNGAAFEKGDEVLVMFSKTAEAQARFNDLAALKTSLMSLLKEKAGLELVGYALSTDQLKADLAVLQQDLWDLSQELSALLNENPIDLDAINAKQAEVTAKQIEVSAKEAEISAMEADIADAKSDVDSKQSEIDEKKAAITAKANEIKANVEDLAQPKIIGFKDHPKPCNIPCGIFGSTDNVPEFIDENFTAWTDGESSSVNYFVTETPEDPAEWNNAWGKDMVVSVGANWELPFICEDKTYYKMELRVSAYIRTESGTLFKIPLVFEYDGIDKKAGPTDTFSINALINDDWAYGPFYYYPNPDDCAYDFFWNYHDPAGDMRFWSYTYLVKNYNGISRYSGHYYYYHYINLIEAYLECKPEGKREMAMYLHGPTNYIDDWVDDVAPIAADHADFLDGKNSNGALTAEEEKECYLTQSWSMSGVIGESGLTLSDSINAINFPNKNDTAPFGPFGLNNADSGDIFINIQPITERHHVFFRVDAMKTDNGEIAIVSSGEYDGWVYGPSKIKDNAGSAQFYMTITKQSKQ